jgi:hypothetical protein
MAPTLDQLIDALHARFATIPDFVRLNTAAENIALLKYEPPTIQHTPLIYTLVGSTTFGPQNPTNPTTYRPLSRLVLSWQDPKTAEAALRLYMPQIAATINTTPTGQRLGDLAGYNRGSAYIVSATPGWMIISGVTYRICDFITEIIVK